MVSGEGDKTPIATISSTAGSAAGSLEIPAVPPRPESPPDLPPSRIPERKPSLWRKAHLLLTTLAGGNGGGEGGGGVSLISRMRSRRINSATNPNSEPDAGSKGGGIRGGIGAGMRGRAKTVGADMLSSGGEIGSSGGGGEAGGETAAAVSSRVKAGMMSWAGRKNKSSYYDSREELQETLLAGEEDRAASLRDGFRAVETAGVPRIRRMEMDAIDTEFVDKKLQKYRKQATLRRKVSIAHLDRLRSRGLQHWMLPPDSLIKVRWDALVVILVLYNATKIPFQLAFAFEDTLLTIFDYLVDVLFAFDIYMHFHVGYFDRYGLAVLDPQKVRRRYMVSWFPFDLIAVLPFELLLLAAGLNTSRHVEIFALLKLPRLLRMYRLSVLTQFNDATVLRVLKLLVGFLLVAHWMGCGFFLLGRLWGEEDMPSWVDRYDLRDEEHTSVKFTHAVYWALTTMTTVGYGDLVPQTDAERWYAMCVFLLGAILYSSIFANVSLLLQAFDASGQRYRTKMDQVRELIRFYQVPPEVAERVRGNVDYYWSLCGGHNMEATLESLHPSLRREVAMCVFEKVVRNVPMFTNASSSFIKEVVVRLRPQAALPGGWIFKEDDAGRDMWFVGRGVLEVILSDGTVVDIIAEGGMFGENVLFFQRRRTAGIRAATYVELFAISRSDFLDILEDFPEEAQALQDAAEHQYQEQHKQRLEARSQRQKSAEQGSGDGDGGGSDSDDSSVDGLALTPDANAVGTKIDGNGDLVAIGTGTGAVAPACDGPAPDGEGHRATFLGAQVEKAHTFLGADGTNRKGHHFDTSSARRASAPVSRPRPRRPSLVEAIGADEGIAEEVAMMAALARGDTTMNAPTLKRAARDAAARVALESGVAPLMSTGNGGEESPSGSPSSFSFMNHRKEKRRESERPALGRMQASHAARHSRASIVGLALPTQHAMRRISQQHLSVEELGEGADADGGDFESGKVPTPRPSGGSAVQSSDHGSLSRVGLGLGGEDGAQTAAAVAQRVGRLEEGQAVILGALDDLGKLVTRVELKLSISRH